MSRTYRVGLVGLHRGAGLVSTFAGYPRTTVAALCDLDQALLAEMGGTYHVPSGQLYTRFDDLVNAPIDVVVVSTPIQFHAAQAIAAMESGKHVLSEVTAAWTLEQCEQLVNAVKRTGQVYMMAENCCYFHFIREWKGWLQQGRLGKIFHAEAEYVHPIPELIWNEETGKTSWRAQRPPIYYCSHSLGPLLHLMEDRVVKATGAHSGYDLLPESVGPGALNMEVALFKTQKGATIKLLRSSVAKREPAMHFYVLYGTRGFIENGHEGGWGGTRGRLYVEGEMPSAGGAQPIDCPVSDPHAPAEALAGGHGTSEHYLVRDFIAAIDENARPPIDVIKAMDMTVPGICAHQAAMTDGWWVDVPLFNW